eukprot:653410-Rhodomonas_salina.1
MRCDAPEVFHHLLTPAHHQSFSSPIANSRRGPPWPAGYDWADGNAGGWGEAGGGVCGGGERGVRAWGDGGEGVCARCWPRLQRSRPSSPPSSPFSSSSLRLHPLALALMMQTRPWAAACADAKLGSRGRPLWGGHPLRAQHALRTQHRVRRR